MEDEDDIRETISELLLLEGYRVRGNKPINPIYLMAALDAHARVQAGTRTLAPKA